MSDDPKKNELFKDIWPQERDYIAKPERYKYLRRAAKTEGCVFCNAHQAGVSKESLLVYKNQHAMVILNKYPYNSGHTLVLPARHCGDIENLSDDEFLATQVLVREVMRAMKVIYNCQGINVGLNHGSVAGAGIPEHLHWHIIPRWSGDTNFFPLIAETKVVPETVEQTYDKMKSYFDDYQG